MSQASYAAGTRFLSLIGGMILSFYDWYADLPPASPQAFGDQTDVPESGDWFNAGYLLIWGTNLPTTQDAGCALHDRGALPRPEGRGRLTRTTPSTRSSPTTGCAAQPGSDGALAMAMGHVILKEFYVDRQVPYFQDYARRFTDLPLLVTLRERDGRICARPAAARLGPRGCGRRARARRVEAGRAGRGHRASRRCRAARSGTVMASRGAGTCAWTASSRR